MAKESAASRRARVKFQLRDRKGRWIEMGRGVKWYSPRLGREVSGTVVGAKGRDAIVDLTSEPKGANGKPQQVKVKGKDIEVVESKATLNPDADTVKATNDLLKQADAERRARLSGPKAEIRRNVKSGPAVMEREEEDELDAAPEEDPDLADLEGVDEDLDLDEDLNDSEPDEDADEAPAGPTDRETMEATIDELEAVIEDVSSGDLDQAEIDTKLAEEVYEIIGNDDSAYSLDVKKSNGKWNYRVKDSSNETVAMIPADENDSVDAAEKMDTAINGKAKATTESKPEAPAKPQAESKPDAAEDAPENKKTVEAPKSTTPVPEGDQKGLFAEPKRTDRKTLAETRKEFEGLPEGTKIHFADAMGENPESYQKFKDDDDKDVWAKMEDAEEEIDPKRYREQSESQDERELLTNAEMARAQRDRPYDKETPSVYDGYRDAVRKEANDKRLNEPVKHDVPLQRDSDKAEPEANANSAKTSKNAADALKFRMDMEPDKDHGIEIDDDNNVTVTDPAKAEHIFNAAAGDTKAVTNRPGEGINTAQGKETRDELDALRSKLGVADNTAQRQQEMKDRAAADRAPQGEVVEGIPATALGIMQRTASAESAKAGADRKDLGFNFDRDGKLRVTDRDKAAETISGLRENEANNRFNRDAPMNAESLSKALDVLNGDSDSSDVPAEAPEAAPEAPEATDAPATPETDSDASEDSQSGPKKVTAADINSRGLTEAEESELGDLELAKYMAGLTGDQQSFSREDDKRMKSLYRTSKARQNGEMVDENDGTQPESDAGLTELDRIAEPLNDAFVPGTEDENDAAGLYLSGADYNNTLRSGEAPSETEQARIDQLTGFIDKQAPLPAGTKLYRGMPASKLPEDLKVGDTLSDPAFLSTSLNREEASRMGARSALLEIDPGSDGKALSISAARQSARRDVAIDVLEGESEMLLRPGQSMRVTGIDTDSNGQKVVRTEMVSTPAQDSDADLGGGVSGTEVDGVGSEAEGGVESTSESSGSADTANTSTAPAPAPAVAKTDEEADAEIAELMASLGIERTEPVAMEGEKYPPTRQQQDVIDAVLAGKNTKVQAMAGTGKTSTLEALSRRLEASGKKAVYVAFNKTVQLEANERMPGNVESRTGHSLANTWAKDAMPFLGIRMRNEDPTQPYTKDGKEGFKKKSPKTSSNDIARVLGIDGNSVELETSGQFMTKSEAVLAVKRTVNSFALSDLDEVSAENLPSKFTDDESEMKLSDAGQAAVVDFAKAYWDDLSREDGVFRVTHDTYRKHWALSRPDLTDGTGGSKAGASVLYIDEAQDTPPVLAKVVADQNMQKVIVGDQNQAIYAFAENVDYLSEADADIELPLNKSWRFGPVVADAGNRFLQMLESPSRVVGGGGESKRVIGMEDADAVLVRTNAGMVDAVLEEADRSRRVSAPEGTRANLKSLADTVQGLMLGAPVDNPHDDLVGYRDWEEVLSAFYNGDPNVQMLAKLFDVTDQKQLSKMSSTELADQRKFLMDRVNRAIDSLVEPIDGFDSIKKVVEGNRTYLETADNFSGTENQKRYAVLNFSSNLGKKRDPYAVDQSAKWTEKQKAYHKLGLPADGWRWDRNSSRWYTDKSEVVEQFDSYAGEHDVMVSTAHKSKGLEWDRVRIGYDFPAPRDNEDGGGVQLPSDDEFKLAYVAVTRAKKELDVGGLDYVYEMTDENGGLPKTRKGDSDANDAERVEDEAVTPEAAPEAEDNTDLPASEEEAARYDEGTAEAGEEVVTDEAPAETEAAPEADVVVEPETGEEPTGNVSDGEEAVESDLDEDGLTPDEAKWANQLNKAITEGYRSGVGNVKALEEKLDELYERGAARQRGEDPDDVPEAAPAEDKQAPADPAEATPEAEEEVVPEGEEEELDGPVVDDSEPLPEPAPMPVVEEEEDTTGEASDGEEDVDDGAPTDLETVESTVQVLDDIIRSYEDGDMSLEDFNNALNEEVYILRADDGTEFELSMDPLDDGNTGYVLADANGETVHTMGSKGQSVAEAAQELHAKINESPEADAPEAEETPEAPEPEAAPEPAPAPSPAPADTTEAPAPEELPQGGTAPAEPDSRPVHPVKLKAANYPDGTQIKSARTSEVIEKTDGKWHVAGDTSKAADPMDIDTPIVSEMPKQDKSGFDAFDGNIDTLEPGDIIHTRKGSQAAVIGVRDGKVTVVAHNLPQDQKQLRPNVVAVDPATIRAINKFATSKNTDAAKEERKPRKVTELASNRGRSDLQITDASGNTVKKGDTVRTALGEGEVIKVIPSAGPNGSVRVRFANGNEKIMRNNKVTNVAGVAAEAATGGDDPATMQIGEQGTAADGRKFLVGKGNKPIFKGDRVQLADGRIGIVNGIYAGVQSANVKMEDGSMPRKKVSTLDAIDYEAPEDGPDAPEDGPDDNGGGNGGGSSPDAPESGPDSGAQASAYPEFSLLDALKSSKHRFSRLSDEHKEALQGGVKQLASRISSRLPDGLTAEAVDIFGDGSVIDLSDNGNAPFFVNIKRGETVVGVMDRFLAIQSWQGPKVYAQNNRFTLEVEEQNKGVAKIATEESEAFYRSIGVEEVRLEANIDVGGYAWARAGFDFVDPLELETFVRRINSRFDSSSWLEHTPEERKMFDDLASRATRENFENGTHPTPFEFSQLGYDGSDNWLGKRIMLHSKWEGVKSLAPVDAPEQDSAAPEASEPVSPEAPASGANAPISFSYGDNEVAMALEDHMKAYGDWTPEKLVQGFKDVDPSGYLMEDLWDDGGAALAKWMSGEGTPKELFEASATVMSAIGAASMQKTVHRTDKEGKYPFRDLKDGLKPLAGHLEEAYVASLKSIRGNKKARVTDVTNYDGTADFSGFDWSTSKFNPNSEAGKQLGDYEGDLNATGLRNGTYVRNTKTGEFGVIDGDAGAGKVSVYPAKLRENRHSRSSTFDYAKWDVADIEEDTTEWSREARDFRDYRNSGKIVSGLKEMYPDMSFNFEKMPAHRTATIATTISGLMSKYPMLRGKLMSVGSIADVDASRAFAAEPRLTSPGVAYGPSRVMVNHRNLGTIEITGHMGSKNNWYNPIKPGNEFKHTLTHEMGHVLDSVVGRITEDDIIDLLKEVYPGYQPGNDDHLREMSKNGIIPRYPVADDVLDVGELVAEAFADAELNATEARPLSKLIHQYLMERLQED